MIFEEAVGREYRGSAKLFSKCLVLVEDPPVAMTQSSEKYKVPYAPQSRWWVRLGVFLSSGRASERV